MLITAAIFTNPIEAHILRGRLEVEGITAFVIHEYHIWANWLLSNALGGVKVQVSISDIQKTTELLTDLKNAEFENILEENEGPIEALICPNCSSQSIHECRWSEKLSLVVLWVFGFPVPYIQGKLKCLGCGNTWLSKERKSYPVIAKIFAILLITMFFMVVIEGTNHICKISSTDSQCFQ